MSSMRLALAIDEFKTIQKIERRLERNKANLEADVALLSPEELAEYVKATKEE
jgi:hypothetical protein